MAEENKTKFDNSITKRADDYSKWYLDVIAASDLADNSPVRGCMVIKPYGYALWENMQRILDAKFKDTGVENAYFPLFIPQSFLAREAQHVDGFAKECAVVTHHRLEVDADGKLVPAGLLDEPLIIRPTSETIMYEMYSKWIQSYRDLPLLLNQWANVVRWEMRTRPFLRTTEFLWQEGHTAHASKEEAEERTMQMLDIYKEFVEEYMALPVIAGNKTESEKFAGADYTACIESMMQDGKALQTGTSHMLGQNFAKVFNVRYLDNNGDYQYVWQTSWGVSTRMIGALIMAHSDDKGLVMPPKLAPIPVIIIPVFSSDDERASTVAKAKQIQEQLKQKGYTAKIDDRDMRPGPKFFEWERKGIPLRIEIGPKDLANGSVVMVDRLKGDKKVVVEDEVSEAVSVILDKVQKDLYANALKFREENTRIADTYEEFKKILDEKSGFISAHWCGSAECEAKIKEETKATTRCIPFDQKPEKGKCIYCGKGSEGRIIFARAY